MRRIALTDGSGRWFDADQAERWDEREEFDGRNLVSCVTGSQWEHEYLYRTSGGRWILHKTSAWQGVPDRWVEISSERAAKWFARNGLEPPAVLREEFAALELR